MHAVRNQSAHPLTDRFQFPDLIVNFYLPTGMISRCSDKSGNLVLRNQIGRTFSEAIASEHDAEELTALLRRMVYNATVDVLMWLDDKPAFVRFESIPPQGMARPRPPFHTGRCTVVFISEEEACDVYEHDRKSLKFASCWEWETVYEDAELLEAPEEVWTCY